MSCHSEHWGPVEELLAFYSAIVDGLRGLVVDELLGTQPVRVERSVPASTVEHLREIARRAEHRTVSAGVVIEGVS